MPARVVHPVSTAVFAVVFAVVSLLTVSCGGGDASVSTTAATGDPAATSDPVATTESAPGAAPTTLALPAIAGVRWGSGLSGSAPPAVVGAGDGFVLARPDGGSLMVSSDGGTWEPVSASHGLVQVSSIVAAGDHVIVLGSSVDGSPAGAVSDDLGASWRPMTLPVAPTTSPVASVEVSFEAVAFDGTHGAAVVRPVLQVDWRQIAVELTGVDHGVATGATGDGGDEMTVDYEDGASLTVDLTQFGLSGTAMFSAAERWTLRAGDWAAEPFATDGITGAAGAALLAAGPNGLLHVGTDPTVAGAGRNDAWLSTDGTTWQPIAAPLPDELATGATELVGGPLGYVAVSGDGSVWFSDDGSNWSPVHRVERSGGDGAPVMGRAAAGAAGFALLLGPASGQPTSLAVSSDGRDWRSVELDDVIGDVVDDVVVAVSDRTILLAPWSSAHTSGLPADPVALRAWIIDSFLTPPTGPGGADGVGVVVDESAAACIADRAIERLGTERLVELGFGEFPWHTMGYAFSFPYERADAEVVVQVFRDCTEAWPLLLIGSFTQGAEQMSRSSAECVADQFDADRLAEIFVLELARDDLDDPDPALLAHLGELQAALDVCLPESERRAIDLD